MSSTQPPDLEPQPPALRNLPGLRVAIYFFAVMAAIWVSTSVAFTFILGAEEVQRIAAAPPADFQIGAVWMLCAQVAAVPAVLAVTLLFLIRLERRPASKIGLRLPANPALELGLAFGLALLTLGCWWAISRPWVQQLVVPWDPVELEQQSPWLPLEIWSWVLMLLCFLLAAFLQELIFRGYVYSAFRERFQWIHAAGFSAVLSLAMQSGDPDVRAAGLINVFLLGMALAAIREATGSLWMSSLFGGLWNLLLGSVLALPVSGLLFPRRESFEINGPEVLTGGSFGPEGSWLMTALLVGLVVALTWWVEKQRGEHLPVTVQVVGE